MNRYLLLFCVFSFLMFNRTSVLGNNIIESDTIKIQEVEVKLNCLPMGDSILIRWAPKDYDSWQYGNKYGYTLTRKTIIKNGVKLSDGESLQSIKLLGDDFKPWEEERWKANINENDTWEVLGAGSIYGEFETQEPGVRPGSPTDLMNQQMARDNKVALCFFASCQSLKVADRLGLSFVDRDVVKGDSYRYEIFFNKTNEVLLLLNHDQFSVRENIYVPAPLVEDIEVTPGDSTVSLMWNTDILSNYYLTYYVERSGDAGLTYEVRNDVPLVAAAKEHRNVSFTDSLTNNDAIYHYRIRGKTPFATLGEPSIPVFAKGEASPDINGDIPFLKITEEIEEGVMLLGWQFNSQKNELIKGFNIYKCETYEGEYILLNEELIPAENRMYRDMDPYYKGFYKVEVVDNFGGTQTSIVRFVELRDLIAPAIVSGLKCELDTISNEVDLSWDANKEIDLDGYRIYYSWSEDGHYIDVDGEYTIDTTASVPIQAKRNGESVFFKLQTFDYRGNKSDWSPACEIELLDVTYPTKGLIRRMDIQRSSIGFEWAASPSNDVVSHEIYRREEGTEKWQLLETFTDFEIIDYFKDNAVEKTNVYYYYKLTAVDKSGLRTDSEHRKAKIVELLNHALIENFTINENEGSLELNWDYISPKRIKHFKIFRQKDDGAFRAYETLNKSALRRNYEELADGSYQYKKVLKLRPKDQMLKFKLMAVLNDGSTSPMSAIETFVRSN